MATSQPLLAGAALSHAAGFPARAAPGGRPAIVLVHGGFVDGSGWERVYRLLRRDGYDVTIVQNPTESLAGDVAATRRILEAQDRPVVLVGHSYGGAVITEAGNDPRVAALVYVAGFAPDAGESVATLTAEPVPGAPAAPIVPLPSGFLIVDRARFPSAFAADVEPELAAFMADAQTPWGPGALTGTIGSPAWRSKPSWYLVAAEDRMIPPVAQRMMARRAGATVLEAKGSHSIYVSRPEAVADLVRTAAASVPVAAVQ